MAARKGHKRLVIGGLVLAVVLGGLALGYRPVLDWVAARRAVELGGASRFESIDVPEPSGIAYHPGRGTLLIASDEGFVVELDLLLKVLGRYTVPGDLEAIAVHPRRGTVYVTSESENAILEYDLQKRRILRMLLVDFSSDRTFGGKRKKNKGLEGICFVPGRDGEPRMFAVVESAPARLIELSEVEADGELVKQSASRPLLQSVGKVGRLSVVNAIDVGVSRLSDVTYEASLGGLILTSSSVGIAIICKPDGDVLGRFRLPGRKPEGLAFLPNGDMLVVQDTGGLWRVRGGLNP